MGGMNRRTEVSMLLAALCAPLALAQTDSAYRITDAYVVVEAEDLPRSSRWQFLSVDTYTGSYTGRGYVRWNGPNQSCASLGQPEDEFHNDLTGACQGSPADWLRVPVYIERAATYVMDLHNLHLQEDGDNDVWTHVVGRSPPVVRIGSHHPGAFDWISWGPPEFSSWYISSVPAVYEFYVAGRSPGFCVDRIAIYRRIGPDTYPPEAHDLSTPVSVKSAVPTVGASPSRRPVPSAARAGVFQPRTVVDLRGREAGAAGTGVRIAYGPNAIRCRTVVRVDP